MKLEQAALLGPTNEARFMFQSKKFVIFNARLFDFYLLARLLTRFSRKLTDQASSNPN